MPHEDPDHAEAARLRGKRIALGVVIAIAVAFIGASVAQIIGAVFGTGVAPMQSAEPGSAERTCAFGVRGLERALERASSRILSSATTDDEAVAAFREGLSPEWEQADAVRRACARAREGLEAWAALQRLLLAQEQLTRYVHVELAPLRRDVIAHLPMDLR
jgi:hypothetical protein